MSKRRRPTKRKDDPGGGGMGKTIRIAPEASRDEEGPGSSMDRNEEKHVPAGRMKSIVQFKAEGLEEMRTFGPSGTDQPQKAEKKKPKPKPGKAQVASVDASGDSVSGVAAAGKKPSITARLFSLYYNKSGTRKDFVSFARLDVPQFVSVEGDRAAEAAPSGAANQAEDAKASQAYTGRKLRRVVIAPSIFELKAYRDLFWLIFLFAVVGFMIGVGVRTWNLDAPPKFICKQYPCEVANSDGTYTTYYTINKKRNKKNGLPFECLASYNTTGRVWVPRGYQIHNATFNPQVDCATVRTMYHVLIQQSATGDKPEPWALLIVAATPVGINLFMGLIAPIFGEHLVRIVFGLTAAAGFAGVALSAYYGSLWAIAWGFIGLVAAATLFFTRYRYEKLEMPLARATKVLFLRPQLLLYTIVVGALECMWFVGWIWVYLKLASRMGTAADVFLFFSLLWFQQFLNKSIYATSGAVFASWYYGLGIKRGRRRIPLRHPLWNGVKRCSSTSLGTVSAWATLDVIIKSLTILQNSLRTALSARSQVLAVLVGIVRSLFKSVNPYGLMYSMVYGKGLVTGSLEAFALIDETNIVLVAADELVNYAGMCAGGLAGMANVFVAWILAQYYLPQPPNSDRDLYTSSFYLPAFFLGVLVGAPILTALEGMIAMLYLVFADRPEMLSQRDNELYMEMADMWAVARDERELDLMTDQEFDREDELGRLREGSESSEDDIEAGMGGRKKAQRIKGAALDMEKAEVVATHVATIKV